MRHLSKLIVNSIPPITVICCRTPEWRVILRIIFNDPILHFLSSVSSRFVSTSNPPVNMRNHTTVIVICFNSQCIISCLPPWWRLERILSRGQSLPGYIGRWRSQSDFQSWGTGPVFEQPRIVEEGLGRSVEPNTFCNQCYSLRRSPQTRMRILLQQQSWCLPKSWKWKVCGHVFVVADSQGI